MSDTHSEGTGPATASPNDSERLPRNVPLALLRSPVNVSVRIVRRFAHVKYVPKVELKRLANDPAGVRKEVHREVVNYLSSLA